MKILTTLLGALVLFPIALVQCDNPTPEIDEQDLIGSLINMVRMVAPG